MELKLNLLQSYAKSMRLLIVPYGIETIFYGQALTDIAPFNRTLWN